MLGNIITKRSWCYCSPSKQVTASGQLHYLRRRWFRAAASTTDLLDAVPILSFHKRRSMSTATVTAATATPLPNENAKEKILSELPFGSQPLGFPLPFDEHACSVSLPTWCSVVGYEEGDQEVTSAMTCGYPRFVYHPYVLQVAQIFLEQFSQNGKEDCLVLPTKEAALRCQSFLRQALELDKNDHNSSPSMDVALLERPVDEQKEIASQPSKNSHSNIRVESFPEAGVHAVLFPAKTEAGTAAKAYWQHTGEIVSSRRASHALRLLGKPYEKRVTCCPQTGTPAIYHSCEPTTSTTTNSTSTSTRITIDPPPPSSSSSSSSSLSSSDNYFTQLQERLAGWTNVPQDDIFLLPSGMATIYKCLRSARRYQLQKNPSSKGGTSIVYGFPYLDTLKMCSRSELSPAGVEFFGKGDVKDMANLERILKKPNSAWSAIFTEVPSNPLLQCPDLEKLRELADEHDCCLVVDDTIGNFLNIDMIESGLADAVCTSLTKLVSGRGDAIAGSVILNPHTEKGRWMRDDIAQDSDMYGGLYEADARAMVLNSFDFPERNAKINATSERLADYLDQHPDVEQVWYPKLVAPLYPKYMKEGGGYGGLLSIHLDSHICQRTFYDALDVAKGPSLGTNFTLVCPYTLLAHYHELDFAISYNVPPNLIRIAVGLEEFDELREKFDSALRKSRLHPKISRSSPAVATA